jgi:hypothetical protein
MCGHRRHDGNKRGRQRQHREKATQNRDSMKDRHGRKISAFRDFEANECPGIELARGIRTER